MYEYLIFLLVNIVISLFYLTKYKKKEEFDDGTNHEKELQILDKTQNYKEQNVFLYNLKDKYEKNKLNEELIKFYAFYRDQQNSKIVMYLASPDSVNKNDFFITFYVNFKDDSKDDIKDEIEIITSNHSFDNKIYWYLYKLNNELYLNVNNEDNKFNIIPKYEDKHYNFVAITYNNNKLLVYIDGEQSEEFYLNDPIKSKSIIMFGGDKSMDINSSTKFSGKIGNIKYGYNGLDVNDIYKKFNLKCHFYPSGDTPETCKTLCEESGCDVFECKNICDDCNDRESCKWIPNPVTTVKPVMFPDAPNPIRTLGGNKKIVIEWKKPFEGTNGRIISYIITVKESYPKDKYSNEQQIYNFEANNCDNCQFEINNLKNSIYYDISVKSQNEVMENKYLINNISNNCSNVDIVAPIGPINSSDFHEALIESDEEIRYNQNLNIVSGSCKDKKYKFGNSKLDNLDMDKYSLNNLNKELEELEDKNEPQNLKYYNKLGKKFNQTLDDIQYNQTYDNKYDPNLYLKIDNTISNYLN